MYTKKHLISILGYIGIGFISGAISHGFFSGKRSAIMAFIGIVLFLLSEYLKKEVKNYTHLFIGGLIYSVAVGMVNGGFQHFLDSPIRSLRIVPVGWILSTIIYPYKENMTMSKQRKSRLIGCLIGLCLYITLYSLLHILPQNIFGVDNHHG